MSLFTRFRKDRNGQAAILFGLMLAPVLAAVGAGLDYARAANVRTALQSAVDSAALTLAREAAGMSSARLSEQGRRLFDANFHRRDTRLDGVDVVRGERSVRITARATVATAIMTVFHIDTMPVSASSEVAWGRKKIELALVLDNTGSMSAAGKLPALKTAVRDLLKTLEDAAQERDAVKISIVPFNTQVKLATDFRDAGWLTYGADLPRAQRTDRAAWRGCVVDRDQPQDAGAGGGAPYPAAKCDIDGLARVRPLTNDFGALRSTVEAMIADGYTNITLGAAWGLAALTPGAPFGEAQAFGTDRLEKIMIVLTDGDNTRNRFTSEASAIDDRTRLVCREIKAKGIRLYTIRVIDGNRRLLRECATKTDMYHEVNKASELAPVFQKIAAEISGIRLTH